MPLSAPASLRSPLMSPLGLLVLTGFLLLPSAAVLISGRDLTANNKESHSLSLVAAKDDSAAAPAPLKFPDDFAWGAATAAYQIEGAAREGGRSPSVFDTMTHMQPFGSTGDVADDHYHRYKDDVALMAKIGLKAYRLSISWSRLIPDGTGPVNEEGALFYSNLIDELLKHDIEPWVTMYHWDLPQVLQRRFHGWVGSKDDIVPAFAGYARTLFKLYGDRVKHWITLNEPWCVAKESMAPVGVGDWFVKGPLDAPYQTAHNLLLSHSEAVRIYREEYQSTQGGKIGITLNLDWGEPKNASDPKDVAAAQRANDFMLGWFADPIFKSGDYPAVMRERLGRRLPVFTPEESAQLKGSADFMGINFYFAKYVTPSNLLNANMLAGPDVGVQLLADPKWEIDDGGRPITPWALRKQLLYVQKHYAPPHGIAITENGIPAEPDTTRLAGEPRPRPYRASKPPHEDWDKETFEDPRRVKYIRAHLEEIHKAMEQGADVRGYFVWSLMDNFEWSNYHTRFGITHVDYATQARTLKRSARMYADVIRDHAVLPLPPAERYPGYVE